MEAISVLGQESRIGPFGVIPLRVVGQTAELVKLPPMGGALNARELPEPQVGLIEIANLSDGAFYIPAGWVIEGLFQTRMVTRGVLVPAGVNSTVSVACVEQGRWGSFKEGSDFGRAPLSLLLAAGSIGPRNSEATNQNAQQQVWSEVRRLETRSGLRATSSLSQIMQEDMTSVENLKSVVACLDELVLHPSTNGFLITLNGEVLMAEVFPESWNVDSVARNTVAALAFDESSALFRPTHEKQIEEFLRELDQTISLSRQLGAKEITVHQSLAGVKSSSAIYDGILYSSLALNANHEFMKGNIYV
jgi:hypothetical protein